MKKTIAVLCLLSAALLVQAQKAEKLGKKDSIPAGKAVIYGQFIQRLGFSSGGFPQEIELLNVDTDTPIRFKVKATFKSAKENVFCYAIPPGKYAILNYHWAKSKWYGATLYSEPVYKGIASDETLEAKVKSGEIKTSQLLRYTFTVQANTLHYMGTWQFDKTPATFRDDKQTLDSLVQEKYKALVFSEAQTTLPQ
jgi:hypothetical protein